MGSGSQAPGYHLRANKKPDRRHVVTVSGSGSKAQAHASGNDLHQLGREPFGNIHDRIGAAFPAVCQEIVGR